MKKMNIHFVGIKGVGMTPLAIVAKEAGFGVSGSDTAKTFITDEIVQKIGIHPFVGFSPEHIDNADLVITTGAHGGFNNPEVKAAKEKGIKVLTQGEAAGFFMSGEIFERSDIQGISIAGCHGKTTTTAMLATISKEAGLDSSYIIGTSEIKSLHLPGHYGKGKYFIAEADEYATEPQYDKTAKFLWQHPSMAIFTNIEWDHPDIYSSIEEIRKVFLTFANNIHKKGVLILNGDDKELQKIQEEYKGKIISFGFDLKNDYVITDIAIEQEHTSFSLLHKNENVGVFHLKVSGEYNVFNAVGAIIASIQMGIPLEKVKNGLRSFQGTKRRAEVIGTTEFGAIVYDDYAHHPTAIKKTLQALKEKYKDKKLVVIFQPHTYSRTKLFLNQFSNSFTSADTVILTDIYASEREKPDPIISSSILAEKIKPYNSEVIYFPKKENIVDYFKKMKYNNDYLIVMMGAGDIYKLAEHLVSRFTI